MCCSQLLGLRKHWVLAAQEVTVAEAVMGWVAQETVVVGLAAGPRWWCKLQAGNHHRFQSQ